MSNLDPEAFAEAVADLMPGLRQDLELLVRIPSISADGFDPAPVRRSAEATAEVLERSGLSDIRLLEVEGASARRGHRVHRGRGGDRLGPPRGVPLPPPRPARSRRRGPGGRVELAA